MIAIALVRGISSAIIGTNNLTWNSFWVQVEASVSVIAACPIAFRSVFLLSHNAMNLPHRCQGNEGQRSTRGSFWRRISPSLPSINFGVILTKIRTILVKLQLELRNDDGYALSSTVTESHRSSLRFEVSERSAKVADQPHQTIV